MKKLILIISLCSALAMGIAATSAFAYTKGQAEADANSYAKSHYFQAENGYCEASGKNKAGEAQWYCAGPIDHYFGGEWHVNVGPYGEITYARE